MKTLRLSIIIPVYNSGKIIIEMLNSITSQSMIDYEVIVIDDGSTDGTINIINSYIKKDSRIQLYAKEHEGVGAARNFGIEHARGEYIAFLDADDTITENSFEAMNAHTGDKPDIIIGKAVRIDGYTVKEYKKYNGIMENDTISPDNQDLIHVWSLWNKWFKRDLIEKNNIRFTNLSHLEDAVFTYSCLTKAKTIETENTVIYNYYKRMPEQGRSTTQTVKIEKINDAATAYSTLKKITSEYSDDFHAELAYRMFNAPIAMDYLRRIWRMSDECKSRLFELANLVWNDMDEPRQVKQVNKNWDLFVDNRLANRGEILSNPLVSIVITNDVSEIHLIDLVNSIYEQKLQSFELWIPSILKEKLKLIEENILYYDNNEYLHSAKGKYLWIVDEAILFNYDSIFKAVKIAEKEASSVVELITKEIKGGVPSPILLFEDEFNGKLNKSINVLFNKLIRISLIKEHELSNKDDIFGLLANSELNRTRSECVFVDGDKYGNNTLKSKARLYARRCKKKMDK